MLSFSRIQIGKKYERPWLAKEWGYRSYRAFAKGVFCPRASKQIILFVTRIKQESLEQYNDYISGEYLFWEGEKAMATMRELQTPVQLVTGFTCFTEKSIILRLSTEG